MASTLSFSFTKFQPNQSDLIFQADAVATSTGKLRLTKVDDKGNPSYNSIGRALHAAPVHIKHSNGNVASFKTSFSFIINASYDLNQTADGLAFFLAPVNTQAPKIVGGGLLGLFANEKTDPQNQVVAVEFDTYTNGWDPKNACAHIGINVNGIKSVKTESWKLESGEVTNVTVSYDGSTKVLTATLVYPKSVDKDEASYIISTVVDLGKFLPEFVRVGFSAATGLVVQTHDVLSWSFESNLPA